MITVEKFPMRVSQCGPSQKSSGMEEIMEITGIGSSANLISQQNSIKNNHSDDADSTSFMDTLQNRMEEIVEKVKHGDTEQTYQIGTQTFTESEWDKLIEKMDQNIEAIKQSQ